MGNRRSKRGERRGEEGAIDSPTDTGKEGEGGGKTNGHAMIRGFSCQKTPPPSPTATAFSSILFLSLTFLFYYTLY